VVHIVVTHVFISALRPPRSTLSPYTTLFRSYLKAALRLRNHLLASLARKREGTAYVIVGAPTQAEVDWWLGKLNAEHVRIVAPQSECERRVGVARRLAVVEWFDAARRNEWSPPSGGVRRVGEDGWPM